LIIRFPKCAGRRFVWIHADCQRRLCNVGVELFRKTPINSRRKSLRECLFDCFVADP